MPETLSFWEKAHFTQFDYVIVGGGLTGLAAAWRLRRQQPRARVALLERGTLPTGASTRNAGFACFGSLTELLADEAAMGPAATLALVRQRYAGLQRWRQWLGDAAIGYEPCGGYELISSAEAACLAERDRINQWLAPHFEGEVFRMADQQLSTFGFSGAHVRHLLYNPHEGALDPGLLVQALMQRATAAGVTLLTGCAVTAWETVGNGVHLQTRWAAHDDPIELRAGRVAFCTNAFAATHFPELDIRPGRGQVLVTTPLAELPFRGTFHFEAGYYYFRHVGNRVLFGGGRQLDVAGETTTTLGAHPAIRADLEEKLRTIILPGRPVTTDYFWSGIMAFGRDKQPVVRAVHPRVLVAARLSGMGVALAAHVGEQVADWCTTAAIPVHPEN